MAASKPVPWEYTVCAQYPGNVAIGATVSLHCDPSIKTSFRYVIVQLPSENALLQVCELDVFARGMSKIRAAFLAKQLGSRRQQTPTRPSAAPGGSVCVYATVIDPSDSLLNQCCVVYCVQT